MSLVIEAEAEREAEEEVAKTGVIGEQVVKPDNTVAEVTVA